jgi:2-dehydro-3-deoxyphosphooctonate aldolase (KDO 8-P synthase)
VTSTGPILVAGPCVIESRSQCLELAEGLSEAAAKHEFRFTFKASFDKANRTSGASPRGPGLREGLEILASVREQTRVSTLTDIHTPDQAEAAARAADVIQIPALLSRQTDLLRAAAATGRLVNLKKGQFLAPWQVAPAVEKLSRAGAKEIWITERGTSFGHGDVVVDFRSLAELRATGCPVLIDASHGAQRPGLHIDRSGGDRAWTPILARAGAAAGFDGLYLEVHPDPSRALSDADTQWPLSRIGPLLDQFVSLWRCARALPPIPGEPI